MEIKFSVTKKGVKRAYYFSRPMYRWFPLPLAEAKQKLAAGKAFLYEEPKKPEAPKAAQAAVCDERGHLVDYFALIQNVGGNC